ncbi:MAG: hypothetical protein KDJ39_10750 [Gammaproteobacteria bacterium]|nr:hypothetical protein [Gammaproteobacteria bacterium]MCP5299502.1 hypothetical protein [Chromatiaceae bacterium]
MKILPIAFALSVIAAAPVCADTLLLNAIETAPANSSAGVPRPSRGATMETVKSRFGEPTAVQPAVGEPPITRWDYAAFTVYFEHDRVIDSVVHR